MRDFHIYFYLVPTAMFVVWGLSGDRFRDLRTRHSLWKILTNLLSRNEKDYEEVFVGEDRVNLDLIKMRIAVTMFLAMLTLLIMGSFLLISDRMDTLFAVDSMLDPLRCE